MYFDQLLGAARNQKLVKLILAFFVKKSTDKRQIQGTPSGSRPAFTCQPALRSRQISPFFVHFQTFFVDFRCEITEKSLKKVEKRQKKMFQPAFRGVQHPKAGRYTQHPQ